MDDSTSLDLSLARFEPPPPSRLDVEEMLVGDPIRLRYVWRYSSCRVNHRESVAEHSYYVALYAALIGQWLQRNPLQFVDSAGNEQRLVHRLSWERLMIRAVLHDLEEGRTGDMPRFFKHSTPALTAMLEDAATQAFSQIVGKLVDEDWANRLVRNWLVAKDDRLEGRVIAFADFLSVLAFIIQEMKSGNRDAVEHITELEGYYANFETDGYAALRPLVEQTGVIMRRFFHAS